MRAVIGTSDQFPLACPQYCGLLLLGSFCMTLLIQGKEAPASGVLDRALGSVTSMSHNDINAGASMQQ